MTSRIVLPRLLLGLALVAGSLWLVLYRNHLDPALIENAMRTLGPWGPAAHVVLFALGTVLFVPGILFALAGGMLFGPVWGTILNLTGATLGATAAFMAARYLAKDWVRRKAGSGLDRRASRRKAGASSLSCGWYHSFPSICSTMRLVSRASL
jgi:uncharacterized membrane protein YdjX (TVP38/TMEM64 family)